MNENQQPGVWNGWHWRFLTILVVAICLLELIAWETLHYSMVTSVTLGVLIVIYVVIPRLTERRLAHSIIGVVAVVILTMAMEGFFESDIFKVSGGPGYYFLYNGLALVIGIAMSFLYLRLTDWSARKRAENDAKRAGRAQSKSTTKSAEAEQTAPMQRRHERARNKKRKKR